MGVRRIKASPYRQRANEKKIAGYIAAGIHKRIVRTFLPIRAFGETELRFPIGPVPKFTKFKYNKGKHYKIAGGAMRKKATRRAQYSNYDNVLATSYTRHPLLKDILDIPEPSNYAQGSAFGDPKYGYLSQRTRDYIQAQADRYASDQAVGSKIIHEGSVEMLRRIDAVGTKEQHFGVLSYLNKKPE